MVGVLIEMRGAILRRLFPTTGRPVPGRLIGGLLLALFVTLLAVATCWPTGRTITTWARAAVVATLSFGWLLGWVTARC